MAFGFFRRRQKMVMIIMAVLMVSFLIGFQGFEMITQRSRNPVKGTIGSQKIHTSDVTAAQSALRAQELLGLGDQSAMLGRSGEDKSLAYALLQAEAARNGVSVSDAEADSILDGMRKGPDATQPLFPDVPSFLHSVGVDQGQARYAIKSLLAMERNFELSAPTVPPSEASVRELYRDLAETVNLQVVQVSIEDFLAGVKEPSQAAVEAQFKKYRDLLPGQITKDNPFGYGYKIPDQAAIQYMLINQDTVARAVRPSKSQVQNYYNDPKNELKGRKPFSEAREEIEKKLRPQEVQKKLSALQDYIESRASALAEAGQANPYAQIRKEMERDATDLLNTELDKDLVFEGKLSDVVDQVARAANLDGICFPYGQVGDLNIQQDKISVKVANASSVREALDQISVQVSGAAAESQPAATAPASGTSKPAQPAHSNLKLRWVTSQYFERSLFPQGEGTDIFPVLADQTPLMDQTRMESFFLGSARVESDPQSTLPKIVFAARAFNPDNVAGMAVGANGPRLVVSQRGFGQHPDAYMMVWRLWKTSAAHVPTDQELAANVDLKDNVAQDLRTGEAYKLALKRAQELQAAAGKVGLDKAAKDMHLSASQTGPFSRKVDVVDQTAGMFLNMQMRPEDLAKLTPEQRQQYKEAIKMRMGGTMEIQWRGLPNQPYTDMLLRLLPENDSRRKISQNQEIRKSLTEAAFALADTKNVGVAEVQAAGMVLVMQPTDYRPPVAAEYEKGNPQLDLPSKSELANRMLRRQIEQYRQGYFDLQNIKDRMSFVPKQ